MVDIGNFSSTSFENFDINLVQKEVDGGSVSVDQIEEDGSFLEVSWKTEKPF